MAAIITMALSCQKSKSDQILDLEEISRHAIDNLQSEAKQIAYNTMTASEKYQYWLERIEEYIAFHSFDGLQLSLLDHLSTSLSETVFLNQDQQEIYKNNFLNDWLVQANNIIGDYHLAGIGDLLSDPATDVDSNNKYAPDGENEPPDCICNLNSEWTCRKRQLTVSIPPSYTVVYGICQFVQTNGPCTVSNWGCGFLGLWNCNGNHCQF
jgi:hypothetical protein